jgi:hypothetical protein
MNLRHGILFIAILTLATAQASKPGDVIPDYKGIYLGSTFEHVYHTAQGHEFAFNLPSSAGEIEDEILLLRSEKLTLPAPATIVGEPAQIKYGFSMLGFTEKRSCKLFVIWVSFPPSATALVRDAITQKYGTGIQTGASTTCWVLCGKKYSITIQDGVLAMVDEEIRKEIQKLHDEQERLRDAAKTKDI